jgi:hypothetical protein
MAEEYARLVLLQDIPTESGGRSTEVIIYRPTAKHLLDLLDVVKPQDQIATFVRSCCRAINGTGEPAEFKAANLDASDAAEISSIATSLSRDVQDFKLDPEAGDGVSSPLVYTLRHPITLNRGKDDPDPQKIGQIEFQARRLGEISEYLDARVGSAEEFHAFMRAFGHLMGTNLPMSDTILDALDYQDYLIIRGTVMGKLVRSRGRWRRTST